VLGNTTVVTVRDWEISFRHGRSCGGAEQDRGLG
jgi:hypothetical protein